MIHINLWAMRLFLLDSRVQNPSISGRVFHLHLVDFSVPHRGHPQRLFRCLLDDRQCIERKNSPSNTQLCQRIFPQPPGNTLRSNNRELFPRSRHKRTSQSVLAAMCHVTLAPSQLALDGSLVGLLLGDHDCHDADVVHLAAAPVLRRVVLFNLLGERPV